MAKQPRTTASYEFDGTVLSIDMGGKVETFDFSKLPSKLEPLFLELGRKTKLSNFAASAKKLGRPRAEMIREGWAQLMSGEWESERTGGGPTVSIYVEALARIKGVSVGAIQKKLREYDETTRTAILAHPKVLAEAKEVQAEREELETDLSDLT